MKANINGGIRSAVRVALLSGTVASAVLGSSTVLAAEEPSPALEEVIVTGSRIARPNADAASPIVTVDASEFEMKGAANVEAVLQQLPQVVATQNSASNNPGGGTATVNLRNLGSQRTLVLVNGRRFVSYDVNNIVDLNTIPAGLIERVDVVTGGRSAVYGSDAMAGVVNFVMKRNFEGLQANFGIAQTGQSDGRTYNVDLLAGSNLADGRGNVVVDVSYYRREGIFASARSFTNFATNDNGNGTFNYFGGSSSIPQFRMAIPGVTGNKMFDASGNLTPYSSSTNLYNFSAVNYIQVPVERYSIATQAHININDHARAYFEANFINTFAREQLAPTPISNGTTGVSKRGYVLVNPYDPYLSASAQATFLTATRDPLNPGYVRVSSFGRRMLELGPRINNNDRNAFRLLGGIEGDIGGDWKYDAYYSYSRTNDSQVQQGNMAIDRFLAGISVAFKNPTTGAISTTPWAGVAGGGTLVCNSTANNPAPAGCIPINPFGSGLITPAQAAYLAVSAQNKYVFEQKVASAAITNGNLFDIGAGPAGIAVGAESRKVTGSFLPDTYLSSGNVAGFNAALPTGGEYSINELFGEVNVPLLKGLPAVEKLELNGAVRSSNYSNSVGKVTTWAAGLQWSPLRDLTVRGQYQRALRGPSIQELYQGQTDNFSGATDPCQTAAAVAAGTLRNQCIASGVPAASLGTNYGSGGTSYPATNGGNPNLTAEASKTLTFGFVWQPVFLPDLVGSIDYYKIQIDNIISAGLGAQILVNECFLNGNNQYCGQIVRTPGTGEFQRFNDLNVNASTLQTNGVDLDVAYKLPLSGGLFGGSSSLQFRLNGTYVLKNDSTSIAGDPTTLYHCAGAFSAPSLPCGAPDPKWRHVLRTTWNTGPLDVSLNWKHLNSVHDADPSFDYASESLKSEDYFDLSGGYEVTKSLKVNLAINNLLDNKNAPRAASGQNGGNGEQSNTFPAVYDVLGRYFYLNFKLKF
jgi:outer membrane receptor protein involved in Fe transport